MTLKVKRDFAAPAARVFDAWFDPADAARFLFATPDGEMIRCEIDPRVGGGFTLTERRPAGDAEHRGRYLEIDRPHRLVFLFAAGPAEEEEWTRVTIEIVDTAEGCMLTLTHEMDPQWAAYEARTRKGWTTILESLARILEN
ncbi:SRPBCC domain-containing protein [Sphingomonas sp. HF-S4]|uniref:SRPBCC domain-containing protein n=1 Tax=Sphingomonas agrestis TaxID=3080540 RepID=A0ABU3YBC8_9SPHN|nr:SRPBCC domain-containing protein [Sphingomonas sp. HF-S4]MDV3458690.1 SRPBCC domain-containing protein [Sphingomonas sp. HF-S4]